MSQVQLGLLTLHPHRQLMNDGQRLPLGRRALDILSVLAEAHGELVTKDQIMEKVWPGVMVEENAIQVHVTALRKALGDEAGRLTTVRGLGYRLDLPAQPSPVLEAKRCQSSVAVLPFANLTGDTSNEYLCDGLARELIAVLSRHTDLKVPAWQSAAYYKGRSADIRTVARQLGVETVVEGWIRSGGDSVRVGADLIDAQTGFHLWSSQFERKLADICGLDNDLVDSIGAALRRQLKPGKQKTENAEALEYFLKAYEVYSNWGPHNLLEMRDLFGKAVDLDPHFAKAHAGLAQSYFLMVMVGMMGPEGTREARRAAERALALDPTLVEGHTALAGYGLITGNWRLAEDHSGLDDICPMRSGFLNVVGYVGQAVIQSEATAANNPQCADVVFACPFASWLAGDREGMQRWMAYIVAHQMPLDKSPLPLLRAEMALTEGDSEAAAELIALCFVQAGCAEQARDVFRRLYAVLAGKEGREIALAALRRFTHSEAIGAALYRVPTIAGLLMWFHTRLGDVDAAYEIADDLVASWEATGILDMPSLRLLWPQDMHRFRMDPRFLVLCSRLGFVPFWRRYGIPRSLASHPLAEDFIGKARAVEQHSFAS